MKNLLFIFSIVFLLISCKSETPPTQNGIASIPTAPKIVYKYGFKMDDYTVFHDTIKPGESFGVILDRYHVDYPIINKIATKIKDTFDVRMVRAGKPYIILASKDSTQKAQVFIYNHSQSVAKVVEFNDSIIHSYTYRKKIRTIEKEKNRK